MSETAIAKPEPKAIEVGLGEGGSAEPKTLKELFQLARVAVQSGLVGNISEQAAMVIMQFGAELGFRGLAAFNYIYVVGGRARLRPDGAKALALSSGQLEDFREELIGEGDSREAIVTVKRKGIATPIVRRFSMLDARRAGLDKKDNYQRHPDRMLLARARGFTFQDSFADLCGGLQVRETFDLEPGEQLHASAASPVRPKTGADPIFAKLGLTVPTAGTAGQVTEFIAHADTEVRQPFPTHAEADKAIADAEK